MSLHFSISSAAAQADFPLLCCIQLSREVTQWYFAALQRHAQLCIVNLQRPACLLNIHYVRREAVIGALLELLDYSASSSDEQSKFKDLTVKCLIKVTKSLDEDIKTDRTTRALITVSIRTSHLDF